MTTGSARGGTWAVRRLQLILGCLVALTLLFWVVATVGLLRERATVAAARDRAVPAILGALSVHTALSDADRAAWESFRSGEAQLIGPGQRYQNDITTAGQSLEHLAVLNTAGPDGRQLLQAVNGQLVTYQGLVEQADATYRQGTRQLGYTYLTYGSSLLHGRGGLLAQIDQIAKLNQDELDRGRRTIWVDPAAAVVIAVAAAVLLTCLIWAQFFMARTFRRTINAPLFIAGVLLSGLVVWGTATIVRNDHAFQAAERRALPAVIHEWGRQIGRADAGAQTLRDGRAVSGSGDPVDVTATAGAQRRLDSLLAAAADNRALMLVLPLLSAAIVVLAGVGVGVRLAEFRG